MLENTLARVCVKDMTRYRSIYHVFSSRTKNHTFDYVVGRLYPLPVVGTSVDGVAITGSGVIKDLVVDGGVIVTGEFTSDTLYEPFTTNLTVTDR